MKSHDGNIESKDFEDLHREVDRDGWDQAAVNMLANEPVLAGRLVDHWARINVIVEGLRIKEPHRTRLLREIGQMLVESVTVTQRAGRRLWDDLLTDKEDKHGQSAD